MSKFKRNNTNIKSLLFRFLICSLLVFWGIMFVLKSDLFKSIASEKINAFELNQDAKLTELNKANKSAIDWLIHNLKDEGYFVYVYNPITLQISDNNNMIRQLMASRVFADLSHNNQDIHELHSRNLEFIFSHWYVEDVDKGYIFFDNKSKLGAIAMALRTVVYSPFFEEYSDKAEKLTNTILLLQNADGSLEPWFIEPDYTYDKDYLLTFYSGEAILALVEYYQKIKNPKILEAAIKSQDFYIDKYVTHLRENYYPAYVPWHTQSLNKLYKITGDKKYADAIFVLNDELLKIQNQTGKPDKKYLGRFYDPKHPEYGSPHSSSDAVYTEGLAYAYEIAKLVGDEKHIQKYRRAIILGMENLMNLQFNESEANQHPYPERILGGIRFNADDDRIRVDTTQHTIDAFTKILEVLFD